MKVFDLFELESKIEVMDIGAAAIAETPIYKVLVDKGLANLSAFDGDSRQMKKLRETYGEENVAFYNYFLFDGKQQNVYLCDPASGMSSILKPKKKALEFFNGFVKFAKVQKIASIKTMRLDDVENLKKPDFIKMDVQGAELEILKNGKNIIELCLAIQLEVSYFILYENQPSFGEIDIFMREKGFIPHQFLDIKRWSIKPTIFNGNIRSPGNQLLESDIVYVRDPLLLEELTDIQLIKLAILAHYSFQSIDYCVYLIIEMEKRKMLFKDAHRLYIENVKSFN